VGKFMPVFFPASECVPFPWSISFAPHGEEAKPMHSKKQFRTSLFRTISCAATAAVAMAIMLALTVVAPQPAQAQTFQVIHNFTGAKDGGNPEAGVTADGTGNLYGTALSGGAGYGAVYQLKEKGSGWTVNALYNFAGGSDGGYPQGRVIFGLDGTLYGTTGGYPISYGTVFRLRPSPTACKSALCPWTETVLYRFAGPPDGAYPAHVDLILDQNGNIYGTTVQGGPNTCDFSYTCGTVFELSPSAGGWSESLPYTFAGSDGAFPISGVTPDDAGNLYGTTRDGGLSGYGTVYELTHSIGWAESCLNSFRNGNDGSRLFAGLIWESGNLYGATSNGGKNGGGTVFELSPSGSCWTYTLLYSFTGSVGGNCPVTSQAGGPGPWGTLAMDAAGNLYGTTVCDGAYGFGNVFKLTPPYGQQNYTSIYDFCSAGPPCSDGEYPISNILLHYTNGKVDKLYGTASAGGSQGVGVVWEITDVP
jgi:uncharacterized repeat protein (TIGR03803 family)